MGIENQSKENNGKTIENNSEMLFIYDARMCNPNGDPDDENKPRMDYSRNLNLVSDVRLKRYIRDYLMDYKKKTIFVSRIGGAAVNAKTSLATILDIKNRVKINITSGDVETFLDRAVDVRMFGAIIPDVTFKEGKGNVTFTGPIQFNWGRSLNKVTGPMESSGITSHFQTGKMTDEEESTKGSGAMGKDYRVDYSLIAFHGIISANRGKSTKLTAEDLGLFDEAMIKAIPLEATTRSKIGQSPLLYIRVEYTTPEFFSGDFRRYVKIVEKDGEGNIKEIPFNDTAKLRSTEDYKLDLTRLRGRLIEHGDKISKIHFWKSDDIELIGWNGQAKELKGRYLFSWENVPGDDSERLLKHLADDHDIDWAKNAEIRKSGDGKTIHVTNDGDSAEITVCAGEKAILTISDVKTHDLRAKEEGGKLNIYEIIIPVAMLPKN